MPINTNRQVEGQNPGSASGFAWCSHAIPFLVKPFQDGTVCIYPRVGAFCIDNSQGARGDCLMLVNRKVCHTINNAVAAQQLW